MAGLRRQRCLLWFDMPWGYVHAIESLRSCTTGKLNYKPPIRAKPNILIASEATAIAPRLIKLVMGLILCMKYVTL